MGGLLAKMYVHGKNILRLMHLADFPQWVKKLGHVPGTSRNYECDSLKVCGGGCWGVLRVGVHPRPFRL